MSKVTRGFRAERWVAANINYAAQDAGLSDSEWLRRAVVQALMEQGYDANYYLDRVEEEKKNSTLLGD